ncbi:MAG TPA: hypothetical protein VMD09_00005 [Solirubrobacteraceae bacterium]|nr:hypothetical protein [Solirubrobacteraceae bacterium]
MFAGVEESLAFIGAPLAFIGALLAFVSVLLAFVGDPFTRFGDAIPPIRDAIAFVRPARSRRKAVRRIELMRFPILLRCPSGTLSSLTRSDRGGSVRQRAGGVTNSIGQLGRALVRTGGILLRRGMLVMRPSGSRSRLGSRTCRPARPLEYSFGPVHMCVWI